MYMWTMSDRAIPRSYRMMQGFGVNTFILVNARGERSFVKFHFTPVLGVHSLVWDEALKLAGQDPDFHRKDLMEAIDNGAYPKWKFGIQVLPEAKEHDFDFDILDATKVWPEDLVPVRYIGELELNRNVDEYFTQTEQVAFCTSHVVPGIGFSDDPLLQGRNFSYFDTQLSRLGVNWQELPINRPVCPVLNFNRDGAMRHTISRGNINYWPNRRAAGRPADGVKEGAYVDYAAKVAGIKVRTRSRKFQDHLSQAQLFFNSLSAVEKAHVTNALCFELDHCEEEIIYQRLAGRLADIDLGLSQAVAQMVGADVPTEAKTENKGHQARNLSQFDFLPATPTIATRKVAILIADGYDSTTVAAVRAALVAASAIPLVIGTRRSTIRPASGGEGIKPDHHLEGMRSTMVDAIFVPGGSASVDALSRNGRALHWIREAFGHLKAIGAAGEGVRLVRAAIDLPGVQTSSGTDAVKSYGVVTMASMKPGSLSEVVDLAKGGIGLLEGFFAAVADHRCWARELEGLNTLVAY